MTCLECGGKLAQSRGDTWLLVLGSLAEPLGHLMPDVRQRLLDVREAECDREAR